MAVRIQNLIRKKPQCACMEPCYEGIKPEEHEVLYLDLGRDASPTSLQSLLDSFDAPFPVEGGKDDFCARRKRPFLIRHLHQW